MAAAPTTASIPAERPGSLVPATSTLGVKVGAFLQDQDLDEPLGIPKSCPNSYWLEEKGLHIMLGEPQEPWDK